MWWLRRLWQCLASSGSPVFPARPVSTAAARLVAVKPRPHYASRQDLEIALLLPWLTDAERPPFLERLAQAAGRLTPWPEHALPDAARERYQAWRPLIIQQFAGLPVEGCCHWLEAELLSGLYTFQTPLALLSRPVRMLWLLRQGRRAGQVYGALEQVLGSRQQALRYAWWVIAEL